jgi:preprotein translocase subunit SecF
VIDIAGKTKLWFGISVIIILIGLMSIVVQGFNWGIDFTGGSILHYDLNQSYDMDDARTVMNNFELKDYEIKSAGDDKQEIIIRTESLADEKKNEIFEAFKTKWKDITLIRSEKVDPVIGSELRNQAAIALLIASIGMIMYITIRFEFKFAIAAIIAIMHDVFVTLGLFSLLNIPINSTFVAAILTIVGYSINDTIVVFDRIRENMKVTKKTKLSELVNKSISQTMTRSLNTSLTTLVTIVALYLLGGETIKDFSLALIVGILAGTYSSIFIASPLWVTWKRRERTA